MTRNVEEIVLDARQLHCRALIAIEGADAATLLEGQLSNHVGGLLPHHQHYTSLSNPKGRLLATGFLSRGAAQCFYLDVPAEVAESVAKRLRMFVLRSAVIVTVLDTWSAGAVMNAGTAGGPENTWPLDATLSMNNGGFIAPRPGQPRRWIVWQPAAFGDAAAPADQPWTLADIQAGVVNLTPATQDQHIAQHAGVDRLGGLHFNKGCYTGQEVIARLHYLGKLKRHLAHGQSFTAPSPGDRLIDAVERSNVGEILSTVQDEGVTHWLAVVQGRELTPEQLVLESGAAVNALDYFGVDS